MDETLVIHVPDSELFDERTNEFIAVKGVDLKLKHSLLSVSRWESKWKKSFFLPTPKTAEEMLDYIRCMTLNSGISDSTYQGLTMENLTDIQQYMNDPMTATTFAKTNDPPNRNVLTAEVIYYQMTALSIPFECEKWHLNRLLTLIRVCAEKNKPPKKMSKAESMARRKSLNAQRKARYHTHG